MNERLKELRNSLGLSQEEFGERVGIKSRAHISLLENGTRNLTDRVMSDICREFSVNEEWLRSGQGDMFVQPSEFSLNEYAEKNNLSELELDLIRAYMDLDVDSRQKILSSMKSIFDKHSEIAASVDNSVDDIEEELESYRLELEAEKKGRILSVSEDIEGSSVRKGG